MRAVSAYGAPPDDTPAISALSDGVTDRRRSAGAVKRPRVEYTLVLQPSATCQPEAISRLRQLLKTARRLGLRNERD